MILKIWMQQLVNLSNYTIINVSFNYDGTFDTKGLVLPPTAHISHVISKGNLGETKPNLPKQTARSQDDKPNQNDRGCRSLVCAGPHNSDVI